MPSSKRLTLKTTLKNMKKTFLFLAAAVLFSCNDKKTTQIPTEDEMGAYIMVYHKDADHSLHMALSYDSYTWTALNNDKPIIAGDTIAMQKGIRDPRQAVCVCRHSLQDHRKRMNNR